MRISFQHMLAMERIRCVCAGRVWQTQTDHKLVRHLGGATAIPGKRLDDRDKEETVVSL